jgi:MFS family permease
MSAGEQHLYASLPAGAKRFLVATLVNMIGNGMIFAFLFIYLNEVRKFSGAWTGAIMTAGSVTGLIVMSLGGWLADHFGAKAALLGAVALAAVVFSLYTFATTIPFAFAISVAGGFVQGLTYPAQHAFTSVIVDIRHRPLVSSWLRIFLNIGAAIGATIAGFIVKVDNPGSFTLLFLLNAATFVAYFVIVATVDPVTAIEPGSMRKDRSSGGYRQVFADKFYVRLLPVDLAAGTMFGMAFMVMPTTFVKRLGASERVVGLVVMSGAIAVIVTQIGVARIVRGRARMLALAAMSGLFTIAFGFGVVSVGQRLNVALGCVVAAQILGGVGEAFLGPTRAPLTADLAPPELMGRYFGLQSMMFQGGFGVATAIGGAGLDISLRGTWATGAVLAALAALWCVRLDRRIPHAVRLSP